MKGWRKEAVNAVPDTLFHLKLSLVWQTVTSFNRTSDENSSKLPLCALSLDTTHAVFGMLQFDAASKYTLYTNVNTHMPSSQLQWESCLMRIERRWSLNEQWAVDDS